MNMSNNNKNKILNFLLRNTNQYNINEIAKILKLSVGSVHKILKSLEERKIVNLKQLGNASYYSLNLNNTETIKYCEFLLIEEKNNLLENNKTAKIYISDLEKYDAKSVILFGSILNKEDKAKDVDVLFIIKNKKQINEINNFCLEISKIRTKKVNPLIMEEKDLIDNIKNKNNVILDILKKGIILKGENLFIKSIKNAL